MLTCHTSADAALAGCHLDMMPWVASSLGLVLILPLPCAWYVAVLWYAVPITFTHFEDRGAHVYCKPVRAHASGCGIAGSHRVPQNL